MLLTHRVAFSLLGQPIYWYALIMAFAVLIGIVLTHSREKRVGLPKDTATDFMLIAIPAAFVCARAYYVAFSWDLYRMHPLSALNVREGGLAIYGGIIGGAIAGLVFTRRRHISYGKLADLCAPALVLGQAIGRWGNFINQEAYGRAILDPAWQFFPAAVWIEASGQWHYATFFYESIWCLMIFIALLLLERAKRFHRPGDLFLWYVALYGLERMLVEGLRTDSLYWGGARVSQLLSAALVACCALYMFLRDPAIRKSRRGRALFALFLALSYLSWLPLTHLALVWQLVWQALLLICLALLYARPRPRIIRA